MKTIGFKEFGSILKNYKQDIELNKNLLKFRVPDRINSRRISFISLVYEKWFKFFLSAKYNFTDEKFINDILERQIDINALKNFELIGASIDFKEIIKHLLTYRDTKNLSNPSIKTVIYLMYWTSAYSKWKYGIDRIASDGSVDSNEITFLQKLFFYSSNLHLQIDNFEIGSKVEKVIDNVKILDQIDSICIKDNKKYILQLSLAFSLNKLNIYRKYLGYKYFNKDISGVIFLNPRIGILETLSFN